MGFDSNDKLRGLDGIDIILGGRGADSIEGGNSNDILNGENGGDFLYGGGGRDTLTGGRGDDTLFGGDGNDRFIFESVNDGSDIIAGGGGTDTLDFSALGRARFLEQDTRRTSDRLEFDIPGDDNLILTVRNFVSGSSTRRDPFSDTSTSIGVELIIGVEGDDENQTRVSAQGIERIRLDSFNIEVNADDGTFDFI